MAKQIAWFTAIVSSITLYEPVFVEFRVTNGHSEAVSFDLGHNRKSNFAFTITEPSGGAIEAPRHSEQGFGLIGRMTLAPGERYVQELLVNEWYEFGEPGDYRIEVRLASPIVAQSGAIIEAGPSSVVHLSVDAVSPARLRETCEQLLRTAGTSSDEDEAARAAHALSHVRHPIAVAYLAAGLRDGTLPWQDAIPGLARIGNAEAVDLLIEVVARKDPERGSALARFVLSPIVERLEDPAVREKAQIALGNE